MIVIIIVITMMMMKMMVMMMMMMMVCGDGGDGSSFPLLIGGWLRPARNALSERILGHRERLCKWEGQRW